VVLASVNMVEHALNARIVVVLASVNMVVDAQNVIFVTSKSTPIVGVHFASLPNCLLLVHMAVIALDVSRIVTRTMLVASASSQKKMHSMKHYGKSFLAVTYTTTECPLAVALQSGQILSSILATLRW